MGMFKITDEILKVEKYIDADKKANEKMPVIESVVSKFIVSA